MSASAQKIGSGALPADWKVSPLSDLSSSIQYGYTAKSNVRPVGPRFLRITDIQDEAVNWDGVPYCEIEAGKKDKYLLSENDLVFARTGATVGKSYLIRSPVPESVFASYLIRVRLTDEVHPKYVAYFFRSSDYWRQISESTAGIGQPNVNGKKLGKVQIPVAPRDQQDRIVDEIEKQFSRLDEAVASLKRVKANLKRYKAAVLKAAVEGKLTEEWRKQNPDVEPASKLLERILAERRTKWEEAEFAKMKAKGKEPKDDKWKEKYKEPDNLAIGGLPDLPRGWCWGRFEQLLENLRNGISKKPDQLNGLAILRISAVRPLSVDLKDVRYLPAKSRDEFCSYELQNEDLLFTRYNGNPDFVGVCGAVRNIETATVHPDKIIRAQVTNDAATQPDYLELALNAGESRSYIASRVRTTAGQSGISGTDIKNVPVPLPPIEEQQVIVKRADEKLFVIEALANQIDVYMRRAERLRSSILGQAFTAGIE